MTSPIASSRPSLCIGIICAAFLCLCSASPAEEISNINLQALSPSSAQQTGKLADGDVPADTLALANEPNDAPVGIVWEFDLEAVPFNSTPLARLQLTNVSKLKVKRAGQSASQERGVLHLYAAIAPDAESQLVGSVPVKPGGVNVFYTIDATAAVSAALGQPKGQRKVRLELRMEGKPAWYEIYGLPAAKDAAAVKLELASNENWTNDWAQRLEPITRGDVVYRESCMPIAAARDTDYTVKLLYPARKVIEVIHNGTGEKLQEGRDWQLRDGKLILPADTHAPLQLQSEFFVTTRKAKDGQTTTAPTSVRLVEGTWYHQRQIEVTYEPAARNGSLPAPLGSLEDLPRLKSLLAAKSPVRIVLFGDSISYGGNSSKNQGCWPYQPCYGELVAWQLARHYGSKITFMNHSRGGATSQYALTQVDSQVACFKPDLAIIAYGMNDRSPERRAQHGRNIEKIVDAIRAKSPDTEFIVIASMVNNPRQSAGLDPILSIRDQDLKIRRPGLALVDVTTAHVDLLQRKDYLDLSGNGANHPNDFLHRIYAQRVLELLIPPSK